MREICKDYIHLVGFQKLHAVCSLDRHELHLVFIAQKLACDAFSKDYVIALIDTAGIDKAKGRLVGENAYAHHAVFFYLSKRACGVCGGALSGVCLTLFRVPAASAQKERN